MTSPVRYPVPARRARVEDDVKNSRFIATIAPAASVDAARAFIESVRGEFPDATHNCWAYVVGAPGTTHHNGASDDGEPGGTAGRPMLSALLASGVGDVAAVVTRYFGGTKLGRGGLLRAYRGAVLRALGDLELAERVAMVTLSVTVPYAMVDAVRRTVTSGPAAARVDGESYGSDVMLSIVVPEDEVPAFRDALADATGGAARVDVEDAG